MSESKVAQNLRAFRVGVASHDRENPDHPPAYGIGVSQFDLERLGFEEGEELWPSVRILVDGKTTGNFRVLCSAEGDQGVRSESVEAVGRDLVPSR